MDLMVVFSLAVILGILFRLVSLPSLVGQVLAGFLAGMFGVVNGSNLEQLRFLGSIGVTLLLFLVGLEMNFHEVKKTGKSVIKMFFLQTGMLGVIFFGFSFWALRLSLTPAILLAVAMTFSSTIVVVKMLSESKDLSSYSGKISLGVLLLQDLLAIFLLVMMPGFKEGFEILSLGRLILKLGILLLVINILGQFLIINVQRLIKTTEDLVLLSLVWFFISVFFSVKILNLTPEIGGILAGVSLSKSWGHFQIVSKVRTLRDIFLTLFFVLLGLEIGVGKIDWLLVLQFFVLATVVKFAVTEFSAYLSKLPGKAAFSVSINMTQISEFGLIVLAFGLTAGFWENSLVTALTLAGLISMVMSTVLMHRSAILFKFLVNKYPKLLRFGARESVEAGLTGHIVLLGGDRTGRSILTSLRRNGEKVLTVDFNPEVVSGLKRKGEVAVFGDVSDPEIIEVANMDKAKMIISTVKDINDSLALLAELKQKGIAVPTIVDAESAAQAGELYDAGASYVIFPHFVSGMHLGQVMKKFESDTDILKKYRDKQKETLKEIYEGEF